MLGGVGTAVVATVLVSIDVTAVGVVVERVDWDAIVSLDGGRGSFDLYKSNKIITIINKLQ